MSDPTSSHCPPVAGEISAVYEHACKVALNFVRQYYTMLHTDPSQLHRFYVSQSAYVHGGNEADRSCPALGQREIQEKVDSLGFREVHASIKQVDALPSGSNGILIQVTGELSTRGHPMRAFVQSFVLSQDGPKKYSIVADIFRYQEDGEPSEQGEEPDYPAEVGHEALSPGENGGPPQEAVPSQPIREQEETGGPAVPAGSQPITAAPEDTETTADWAMDGDPVPPEDQGQNGPDEYTADPYGNEDTEDIPQEGKLAPLSTDEDYEPLERQEGQSAVAEGQERESADPGGIRNMSYASISSKHVPPGANKMAEPRFTTRSYTPKKKPAFQVTNQISGREPRPGGMPPGPYRPKLPADPARTPKDQFQIFVGGLPKGCRDDQLADCFSPHGTVTDVRIHPNGYGFVSFASEEHLRRVVETDRSYKIGPNSIRVERKGSTGTKTSYPRRAPAPSKPREAPRGPLPPKY